MSKADEEYLAGLRRHAAETRTLLSNAQKQERERMVVRAFLRCIGLQSTNDEIVASAEEPIDVTFRAARFQLMDIVGERMRGKDWRERELKYQDAKSISDVLEPWESSTPKSFAEIAQSIAASLSDKATRYGVNNCSVLDALVYVDLKSHHLWPLDSTLSAKTVERFSQHGWRSVSMLFVPYGAVLSATQAAPKFLRTIQGMILNRWPGPDGWFDES